MARALSHVAVTLALAAPACREAARRPGDSAAPFANVQLNQRFIEGQRAALAISDPMTVFAAVFATLPRRVRVYPTENYYYFVLHAEGQTLWGNIRLDAKDRDEGVIHLGYFRYDENGRFQDREGHDKRITAADGVRVTQREKFLYAVSYGDRTVLFELNDVGTQPPRKGTLHRGEVFVGRVFDESALRFFLLFDEGTRHFYFVLDEEAMVPETFHPLAEDLVVGERTGFAFFVDRAGARKLLVGVHGRSTDRNTWYDGPFDQLPDNHVEHTNIQRYLEAAYPFTRGQIDRFGGYLTRPASRVLVFPYLVYYDDDELVTHVGRCRHEFAPATAGLFTCLTPDAAQSLGQAARGGPRLESVGELFTRGTVVTRR